MSGFNMYEVQKSITTVLKGNSTLVAILGNGVNSILDNTSNAKNLSFPYINFSDVSAESYDTTSSTDSIVYVTLSVFSNTGNREETENILKEIHTSLHRTELNVTGFNYAVSRWDGLSSVLLDSVSGTIFNGIIRFKITCSE